MTGEKPIAFSIDKCRQVLSDFSTEDGERIPPEFDWFSEWYEGWTPRHPDCEQRLRDLIDEQAKDTGLDPSTVDGLVQILEVMYFG